MVRTKQTARQSQPSVNNNPIIPPFCGGIKIPHAKSEYTCCGLTKKGEKCSKGLKTPNSFCNFHKSQEKDLSQVEKSSDTKVQTDLGNHEKDKFENLIESVVDFASETEKGDIFSERSVDIDDKEQLDKLISSYGNLLVKITELTLKTPDNVDKWIEEMDTITENLGKPNPQRIILEYKDGSKDEIMGVFAKVVEEKLFNHQKGDLEFPEYEILNDS